MSAHHLVVNHSWCRRRWVCERMWRLLAVLVLVLVLGVAGQNKYSEQANVQPEPFRMGKLNLLWQKAKQRLSETKLNSLLTELKMQDKEELTLKKIKTEGGDKDGIKEAQLRKVLQGIMMRYNLGDDLRQSQPPGTGEPYINEVSDRTILKAIFKDKKLNKLWNKAEASGFTEVELKALKEEFQHQQDKIDEYYALVQNASLQLDSEQNELENDINKFDKLQDMEIPGKTAQHPTNTIREKHQDLKREFDRLHKVTSTGPTSKEFLEPKVSGLWKLALKGDFTQEELESLHTELKHYEHRLLKVRYMSGQLGVLKSRPADGDDEKLETPEGQRIVEERLQKQKRKVEKLHEQLEEKIYQRHLEL